MHKILTIIRREYLQSVRTKMFWIATLIFPLFFVFAFGLAIVAELISPDEQKPLAVIDGTGALHDAIARGLAEHELKDGRPEFVVEVVEDDSADARDELESRVLDDELYGIVTIGADIAADDNFALYRKSVGDEGTAQTIRDAVKDGVIGLRLSRSRLEIDRHELEALVAPIDLVGYQVTAEETRKKRFEEALLPTFGFVLMLFFTLYMWGFAITRGIIQEKSNRVIEVLLGSVSSDQLITGKILGIGLVGLTQVSVYAGVGVLARIAAPMVMSGDVLRNALGLPTLFYFMTFFVLGYFLFATLFAIVGAVCNTEQDAQNLQFPLMLTLLTPYMLTFFFVQHSESAAAIAASFFPPFTPMVMFMRINVQTPPVWQIALSMVLMLVSIAFMFRVAAKVFRIGTLMYGKRPSIPEIWRWARQ